MGRIDEEWNSLSVKARGALINSLNETPNSTPGQYAARSWDKVPADWQQLIQPVLVPDTDATDRTVRAGWSQGKPIYRASMAGHCIKELFLWRVGAAAEFEAGHERDPYRDKGELGAQEGSLHEGWMIDQMKSEGYEVESTGDEQDALEVRYKRFIVRSHPDGLIRGMELGSSWRVLECKALNEDRFQMWVSQGWAAFPGYAHQVSLEMFLASKKYGQPVLGYFVVKNRNTGKMVRSLIDRPPVDPATIINKYSSIENMVESGVTPPCDPEAEWYWCPFLGGGHCEAVKKKDGTNALEVEDPVFVSTIERFKAVKAELKALEAEEQGLRAIILEKMIEPAIKVGSWFAKLNDRSRTGFAIVKAKEFIDANGGNSADFNTKSEYKELRITGGKVVGDDSSGFED